ncbi:MAG: polyamine aminopropyltransferase [Planctomycetota bacterium]|jgi:spermidine synthase|nr:polyamine aminopropyltransferase [Planctomycetota bacterium]
MSRQVREHVNKHFGYFYTVDKSLMKSQTKYQAMEFVETPEFGRVLLLDDITQVVEKNDWLYHEPMVHPSLTCHENPRSVCVIGAGDGGICREVLRHKTVERLVHCDLDGEVVEACREWLPKIHGGCWDDPRTELVVGDGRAYIEQSTEQFDSIIMDMTDPFGPAVMLYTQEYFQAVKARLRDERGYFTMHAESPISRPQTYCQILKTLGSVFKHVHVFYVYIQMYNLLWTVAVAGDNDLPATIDTDTLGHRLLDREVGELEVYTPITHHSMLGEYPYVSAIRAKNDWVPVITDDNPTVVDEIDLNANSLD